jgi:Terminase large subunit, T4likevirus-type, N-terminal
MTNVREIAYRVDPVLWVREELGMTPNKWQEEFLRAPRGSSHLVLTSRQVGKSTAAAWAMAHAAVFMPGSLSVVACPTQRQSVEAVRKVRDTLLKAGAKLVSDNGYGLELENGSRVLALPGSDDSVRGLTVNAYIIADEAARLTPELIAALRPMRARCPDTRLAMLTTAWSRTDPFWTAWESEGDWSRIKATVDDDPTLLSEEFLAEERANLTEEEFKREFLGIPAGGQVSPFTWEMFKRATQLPEPLEILDRTHPTLIAHDVGRSKDRSTAVVGGPCAFAQKLISIPLLEELPQGLVGSARAEALSIVDRRYDHQTIIVADLSFDPTYAELLLERFGPRVIGLQITNSGAGMKFEHRQIKNTAMLVYHVGRSYLFDLLLRELQSGKVRFFPGPDSNRAFDQLLALELETRERGIVYKCPSGWHDDLAISCAILVWAALHPHCDTWCRPLQPRPQRTEPKVDPRAWT